ncbi:MAG: CapA family protein [Coriobacteriia bacterium]|nr:CapA family protein [Coriobacteriia bacterium]MCL2750090.1 CapA family protein [Coriobacteriia bacterium]
MEYRKNNRSQIAEKPRFRGIKIGLSLVLVLVLVLAIPVYGMFDTGTQQTPAVADNEPIDEGSTTIRVSLVGDVCFADGWGADVAHASGGSVAAAFSPDILAHMRSADICYANHEFAMSDRGEPLPKMYTFCASPAYAHYWNQLGVNLVSLANNHAYDYGEDAFLDTLSILKANGVRYVGGGLDLAEAMTPVCFTFGDYTIAFVAADRGQKGDEVRAQAAGENLPGVLFCFDDELFLAAVAEAREIADYVIALPHWGTEESVVLEPVQIELARKLIDAGADAVVGSHPHVLQTIEFYNGKLIAYSLGDFWFSGDTTQTLILDIEITDGKPIFRIIPALLHEQKVLSTPEISDDVFALMRQLSPDIEIDRNGYLAPR